MAEILILEGTHRARKGDAEYVVDIGRINADLTNHLLDLEDKVGKAVSRAIKRTAQWLRTHSVREISKELNIKQAPVRRRFRFRDTGKGFNRQMNIWVGLLAIAAHDAGKAVNAGRGAKVRGRQFDGAFVKRIYGSEEKMYIRASENRKRGHATVTERGRDYSRYSRTKPAWFEAEYGDRFPVQVVGIDIKDISLNVLERYEKRLNAVYRDNLERELNYELNVAD